MSAHPVRVRGHLDEPLSRGLWLVKWLLALPHYLVLGLLWIAFAVLTVIAFFAILFTGRYPRPIFEFNVGVLRWTWRVAFYGYGALGTDRYPPFTLGPAPDYPATLEIDYPLRLSRGLVLVKWWLLAIPHYLIVGLFTSAAVLLWRDDLPGSGGPVHSLGFGGLVGLLVVISAVVLLLRGRYPRSIFDFVLGMNRWTLRVAAYATLMTDAYPPFRLDAGEEEPAEGPQPPPGGTGLSPAGGNPLFTGAEPGVATTAPPRQQSHVWSAGAATAAVLGSLLAFCALGATAAGTGTLMLDSTRGPDGFVDTGIERVSTSTYALTVERVEIAGQGVGFVSDAVGPLRVQVTGVDRPVFVGIAPHREVATYLDGVAHDQVTRLVVSRGPDDGARPVRVPGRAPVIRPGTQPFWTAQAEGIGRQTLTWDIRPGEWALVVMNADASAQVSADVRLGAPLAWTGTLITGSFVAAAVLFLAGGGLITLGVRLAAVPLPPLPATSPTVVSGSV
ncbi:DUF4389 domain-containing protein [Streptosporangium sp. NPDC023825]|uniref:DUF4389 domain-containing protein n=1 Tax=Streptosporangium sp. NPDC023825 TaxID=3154909 RepID=UPI00341DF534